MKIIQRPRYWLADNGNFTGKSKHIDISKRFVTELVAKGDISVVHVASDYNISDILTKALDKNKFTFLRSLMGVCPSI